MDFEKYHQQKLLCGELLDEGELSSLFEIIDSGLDRDEAKRRVSLLERPDIIGEGIFDRLEIYRDVSTDEAIVAHDKIVQSNMKLIRFTIRKIHPELNHIENSDLMQYGYLTLSNAVWLYDNQRVDAKFSTYAIAALKRGLTYLIGNQNCIVRVPNDIVRLAAKVRRENPEDISDTGTYMQLEKVTSYLGSRALAEKIDTYNRSFRRIRSIDEAHNMPQREYFDLDGQPTTRSGFNDISEQLLSNTHEEMEDEVVQNIDVESLVDYIFKCEDLSARDWEIIIDRFGIFEGQESTLKEVGLVHGITRERVRQIEMKALQRLQLWVEKYPGQNWRNYIEDSKSRRMQFEQGIEEALSSLRDRQDIYHAWGRFKEIILNYQDAWLRNEQILAAAKQLFGYMTPEEQHPFLEDYSNKQRGKIEVTPLPDVRDRSVVQALLSGTTFMDSTIERVMFTLFGE